MDYTSEQLKVIELRNRNILVSAAAGSGKTAVLVERIIRLITDEENPVDIDTLLVVTFTRAAAAQMKDKINDAILKRLEEDPSNTLLQRQAALVHNAHISTIDSFCQYVLKNSLTEGEADLSFRIAEEGENKLLEADVLDDLMEQLYSEADEDFMYMVDHIATGADDSAVTAAVSGLYNRAMSGPWPTRWLRDRASDYDCEDDRLPDKVTDWLIGQINDVVAQASEAYGNALEAAIDGKLAEKNIELIKSEYNITKDIYTSISEDGSFDYDTLRAKTGGLSFSSFSPKKGEEEDPDMRASAKNYRDLGKDLLKSLNEKYLNLSYEDHIRHIRSASRVVRCLCNVTIRYIEELDKAKKEKKLLSFADCEQQALDILVRADDEGNISFTDAAEQFRQYFSYVFVDEYQDSNLVQELILSAVSGEDDGVYNRFMVGDVKQSIYRFRQADPTIFVNKYLEYGYDDPKKCKIDLNMNFRSRRQVLDTTNALFERVMTLSSGGSEYDDSASLKPGMKYPEEEGVSYLSELIFADDPVSRERAEGEVIAARIQQLFDEGFMVRDEADENRLRPVRFSDIVILYRSGIEYAAAYKEVLEEHSIPAHLTGSTGYFSTYEISNLMNLLRVLVNPLQDVYFYGTMEGVFGGFTPLEISQISIAYRESLPDGVAPGEGYLYPACLYAAKNCPELSEKITSFLDRIHEYRSLTQYMSVEELIEKILTDTDYRAQVSAMRGGDRRLANVSMLLKKASDFGNISYFGLYNFIRYIDNLKKSDAMDAEAEIVDEDADVVRIMTIHKSKGLEFPVCIVARLGNEFNFADSSGKCLSDYEAGIGIRDVDTVNRLSFDTLMRRYVSDTIKAKTLAEEMRIQYVAMTRAKEKLIMICVGAGKSDAENDTYVLSRPITINHYIDWYLGCICDETGGDSFSVGTDPVYLPTLHISVKRVDISEEDLTEEAVSGKIESGLKLEHMRDSVKILPDDDIYLRYLSDMMRYEYPHPSLKGLYTKTSVSDLKHAAMPEDDEPVFEMYEKKVPVPAFVSGNYDRSGATVRGSAFHRVLELMDHIGLHNATNSGCETKQDNTGVADGGDSDLHNYIISSLDGFLADHSITQYERDIFNNAADMDRLCVFFRDETSERMTEAARQGALYREEPFIMGICADEIDPDFPHDETVLIQGIIDAYWIEDGQAVILDYKTDRVKDPDRLIRLYKKQLDLYERALVQMRIPVKEKLIYSFELGMTIRI